MRARRLLAAILPITLACGVGPVENEVVDTSSPARLTYSSFQGLLGLAVYLVVDSATSSYGVYCTKSVRGQPNDCRQTPDRTGSLTSSALRSLFGFTSTREFLRARSTYDTSPGAVDGPTYEMTITRNGTTRRIVWSRAIDLDRPVADYLARLAGTAGVPVDGD